MIARMTDRAEAAVRSGYNIIILSDRMMGPDRIPIPALLATAAVHHHLIRKGLRTLVGLVVETGEAREIHHFACLAGYGAEAINPYLAFESLTALASEFPRGGRPCPCGEELHQVDRQGVAEGHVQDGHLDLPVLLRRPDLRRRRAVDRLRAPLLHRHGLDDRGRRPEGDRRRDRGPPCLGVRRCARVPQRPRCRRRLCLSGAGRDPFVVAAIRVASAACRPGATARTSTAPTPSS